MRTTRTSLLGLALSVLSLGLATGCGGEDTRSGDPELPGKLPAGHCAPGSASTTIPAVDMEIGFGGAAIPVAGDRLRIHFQPDEMASLARELEAAGMCLSQVDALRGTATVRLPEGMALEMALGQVDTISGIASVQVDPLMQATGKGGKKKTQYDGPSIWHLAALRLGKALQQQPDAAGITVAILDTGLSTDGAGQALAPGLENTPILPGHDYINSDTDPSDDDGHGTMLAGILASEGTYPGVAPGVSILPIKVLDDSRQGTESALAEGIMHAVGHGADIISMSLAFPPGYIPSYELALAVNEAHHAGVLLVGASGNHGSNEIGYPAAFGEVIAVGGGRMADTFKPISPKGAYGTGSKKIAKKIAKADYSGWGAGIDILAPGGSMDHDLDGDGFPDAIPAIGFTSSDPTFDGYLMAGTSPATVQIAGLAALLRAGGAASGDIRPLLMTHATGVEPDGFDIFAGVGVADARDPVKRLKQGKIPETNKLYVNPIVTLAEDPQGNRRAIAMVEVIDQDNEPVEGVKVLAHFRGPTTHAAQAVSDALGRVLMVSEAMGPGADLIEFGVDKVIECLDPGKKHNKCWGEHHNAKCKNERVTIPGTYAQFEAVAFKFFAAFDSGGTGIEPTPFMIFIPGDVLSPIVSDFALSSEVGAPSAPDPVDTIPEDLASYTLVESLLVRSFGAGGSVAPVAFTVARTVLANGCAITEGSTPIPVTGGGIEPTPFRVGEDLTGLPPGFDTVLTRSDGGLFFNGDPTTPGDLGLVTGTTGTILIQADGSVCVPQARDVVGMGSIAPALANGGSVTMNGFTYSGSTDPNPPSSTPIDLDDTALGTAIGQGLVSTSALGGSAQASAAVFGP